MENRLHECLKTMAFHWHVSFQCLYDQQCQGARCTIHATFLTTVPLSTDSPSSVLAACLLVDPSTSLSLPFTLKCDLIEILTELKTVTIHVHTLSHTVMLQAEGSGIAVAVLRNAFGMIATLAHISADLNAFHICSTMFYTPTTPITPPPPHPP